MSKSQKIVIALTGLAAAVQCLFPPWHIYHYVSRVWEGYKKLGRVWLGNPPGLDGVASVDWQALGLQLAATLIIGGTLFLILKKSGNYHKVK